MELSPPMEEITHTKDSLEHETISKLYRLGGGNCAMECQSLKEVRREIDRIDRAIVTLLAERGSYVRQAARFKQSDEDVAAPDRVEQVITRVRRLATEQDADPDLVEHVYRSMIARFIELEATTFRRQGVPHS